MRIEAQGKPLVLGETGDDSGRGGEEGQAELLDWVIPLAFAKGCGICLFSWTDEWVVDGQRLEDWSFGLVDAVRDVMHVANESLRPANAASGSFVSELAVRDGEFVSIIDVERVLNIDAV